MTDRAAEITQGRDLPGAIGAYYRLASGMDPAKVFPWIAGERARGTPPEVLAEVMSGVVADLVFAVAQNVRRPEMKRLAQRIMIDAAEAVDQSIGLLAQTRKQTAIHAAGMRLVK